MTRQRKSQGDRRSLERAALVARRRSGGAAFTLVEMMVALVAGALVVTSVYYIGTVTTRQFVEQDEVSRMQQGLRLAANRLKRDIERAGFLATPNLVKTRSVCDPSGPNGTGSIDNFSAVQLSDDGSIGALSSAEVTKNAVKLDALVLTGNYISVDEQVAKFSRPNVMTFRTDLQGFRRNFVDPRDPAVPTDDIISVEAFNAVYAVGRHVRVVNPTGRQMYFKIAAEWDGTGDPNIQLDNGGGGDIVQLLSGPCSGEYFFLTPILALKYHVVAPGTDSYPGGSRLELGTSTGTHAALVRVEVNLDPADPFNVDNEIQSTAQIVLDNAVYFNVDFVADQRATGTTTPSFVHLEDGFAELDPNDDGQTGAHRLRSAIIRIGARGPREDPRLKWPYSGPRNPAANQPLWRYDAMPAADGTARVREMLIEVPLPNIANADPDIRGAT